MPGRVWREALHRELSNLRKPLAVLGVLGGLMLSTQAQAVIVIRGRNGGCFCIGSWAACSDMCPPQKATLAGYDRVALSAEGATYEGVTEIEDDGTGLVELRQDDELVFEGRVVLEEATATDLDSGTENTLAALSSMVSCE